MGENIKLEKIIVRLKKDLAYHISKYNEELRYLISFLLKHCNICNNNGCCKNIFYKNKVISCKIGKKIINKVRLLSKNIIISNKQFAINLINILIDNTVSKYLNL